VAPIKFYGVGMVAVGASGRSWRRRGLQSLGRGSSGSVPPTLTLLRTVSFAPASIRPIQFPSSSPSSVSCPIRAVETSEVAGLVSPWSFPAVLGHVHGLW